MGDLNTNLAPAQPFLMKPDVHNGGFEPLPSDIKDDETYLYHATNFRNLASIRINGLDPDFGGKGGAGAQVGGQAGVRFSARSANKVHGTSASTTANFYALMKDEPSLFVRAFGNIGDLNARADPTELGDFAIILRFRRDVARWEVDPDDPRCAFRTADKIPPWCIEGLTTEGWTKITFMTELAKALAGG